MTTPKGRPMLFSGRLVFIVPIAVTMLLVSNIVAVKPVSLLTLPFSVFGDNMVVVSAAIICFPITYIISDVLTEVYGFRVARGVIWLSFLCNLIMVVMFWLAGVIPGAAFWESQDAYNAILGATPWILLGSFCAFIVGEFVNATVMVLLKNRTEGRHLWVRTISSTILGQGIDSILFFGIAFGVSGLWPLPAIAGAIIFSWSAKTLYEIAATPLTYLVVNWLKRVERMDIYDAPDSLSPFGIFGVDDHRSVNAAAMDPTQEQARSG